MLVVGRHQRLRVKLIDGQWWLHTVPRVDLKASYNWNVKSAMRTANEAWRTKEKGNDNDERANGHDAPHGQRALPRSRFQFIRIETDAAVCEGCVLGAVEVQRRNEWRRPAAEHNRAFRTPQRRIHRRRRRAASASKGW